MLPVDNADLWMNLRLGRAHNKVPFMIWSLYRLDSIISNRIHEVASEGSSKISSVERGFLHQLNGTFMTLSGYFDTLECVVPLCRCSPSVNRHVTLFEPTPRASNSVTKISSRLSYLMNSAAARQEVKQA